jgi:hypothetical protein
VHTDKVCLQLREHMIERTRGNRLPGGITGTKCVQLAVATDGYGQRIVCAARIDFEDIIPVGIPAPMPARCASPGNGMPPKAFQLLPVLLADEIVRSPDDLAHVASVCTKRMGPVNNRMAGGIPACGSIFALPAVTPRHR